MRYCFRLGEELQQLSGLSVGLLLCRFRNRHALEAKFFSHKQDPIAQSLQLSTSNRVDMTEVLLKKDVKSQVI